MILTPQHSACSESVGGPSGAARGRQPQFRRGTATGGSLSCDCSTTLRRPQNAAQRHVSPSAARSSALRAVSRILVTTYGESFILPVRSRHPKLNVGRRPLARYSDFNISHRLSALSRHIALSESKMAAKITSGSAFDPKFRLLAPSFLLESGFLAVYRQVLRDFTLRAVRCQISAVPLYEIRY